MSDDRHPAHLTEWLPAYLLGALDGEELAELEAHLAAGCAACERELAAWSRVGEEIAATAEPVAPSPLVRARLLRRVAAGAAAERRPGSAGARWAAWAAIAAALVVLVWSGWSQRSLHRQIDRLASDRRQLAVRLTTLRDELAATRHELDRVTQANRIIAAPGVRSVVLAGLEAAPDASGHAYVDPLERRAVFFAYNLPPPDPAKTYQLWFIAGGKPVSAGVFGVDAAGRASVLVDDVAPPATIQAWAVTVEPAGGVPQPTGPMVLEGAPA